MTYRLPARTAEETFDELTDDAFVARYERMSREERLSREVTARLDQLGRQGFTRLMLALNGLNSPEPEEPPRPA